MTFHALMTFHVWHASCTGLSACLPACLHACLLVCFSKQICLFAHAHLRACLTQFAMYGTLWAFRCFILEHCLHASMA
jgi:hypothetical protein